MSTKTNIKSVIHQWNQTERKLVIENQKLLQNTTLKATAECKKEAPVKTGNLRKQITPTIGAFQGTVESRAPYSSYVHDGTRFQNPNPFMSRGRANTIRWLRQQKIRLK